MISILLGTRPEIIKLAPVIQSFSQRKRSFILIHSNQHYSENMDRVFFTNLGLPSPDYNLQVGSGTHGIQTGKVLERVERVLLEHRPEMLVVQGDTNTVAAGALAAVKLNIPVAHVEAGLRSYDRSMPEEINRILADRLADMLFAPTGIAADNLITEGTAQDKIHITGNTIVDVIGKNLPLAEKKNVLKRYNINPGEYILVTVHRQENTDDSERLQNIIRGIATAGKLTGTRVIYPAHPRTVKMLQEFKIEIPAQVEIYEPIDYFSFLKLEKEAALIMTDSGGVQEEACILGVSCVTLRENTERPETLEIGANILSGTDADTISEIAVGMITDRNRFWQHPYGDGNSGSRIADIVTEYLG